MDLNTFLVCKIFQEEKHCSVYFLSRQHVSVSIPVYAFKGGCVFGLTRALFSQAFSLYYFALLLIEHFSIYVLFTQVKPL